MFGKSENKEQTDFDLFVIYDSKVQSYGNPIHAINQHDLTRDIILMFKKPEQKKDNKHYTNAEDYSIFKIGSYSKKLGKIFTHNHESIANMHELRAVADQDPGIVST